MASNAIHLSGITYFWDIATKREKIPWGVTANLLVRRSNHYFDSEFIKTGGGEDIDYCLQLKKFPLLACPDAVAEHPWWSNGNRTYGHFYRWAYGDSLLMEKYPHLTYRNVPNVWEFTLFLLLLLFWFSSFKPLFYIISIWIADVLMDVYHLMTDEHKLKEHSHVHGMWRVLASIESNLVKNSCELGHLMAPFLRRRNMWHICQRFDWFCGLEPQIPRMEVVKHSWRFLGFLIAIFLCEIIMLQSI
eukprot:TRINITY_DN6845_c0_g2_i1.p1 TRINITY_DN6845_c0_g2~~TRINITY_DN6845_c0_g2_i1.p1  ORF type:complete len:246 (+),score=46.41 TRINITY_DN6845_c0_g2_i1:46-783(+)